MKWLNFVDRLLPPEPRGLLPVDRSYVEMLAREYVAGHLSDENIDHFLPDTSAHVNYFALLVRGLSKQDVR